MAEIYSIVVKPKGKPEDPKPYQRVSVEQATLVTRYGIDGDRKGGNPNRQLNVMSYETMQQLQAEGFRAEPGQLGEQIVITGLIVEDLPPGARVQLGDGAIIEVVDRREPCERFEYAQDKRKENAENRIGVMARVIEGGAIRVGDAVQVVTVTA